MKRFAIAAALATVLGLGLAGTADAQYVQRYYYIAPNGNIATTTQLYNPWGAYQSYNTLTSPLGTVREQAYYGDVFGNTYGRAYGYNPITGLGYNRGFYTPSPYVYPYGGYNYNFYGRRW